MKPTKYTRGDISKIDLGNKVISKYPTPTDDLDIAKMSVKGRHPQETNKFLFEEECSFVMYILSGKGRVFVGDEVYEVETEDVIFVPNKHPFAVEGKFEYITVDSPAFTPGQSKEITKE